jgi:hypothetical protein
MLVRRMPESTYALPRLDRAALLRRGGAALLTTGAAGALLAGPAAAAAVPDNDLAYLRLLIGAELLAADVQSRALASGKLAAPATAALKQMAADEGAHYAGLANLVTAAGQTPATSDDIDFAYPKKTFTSQSSILRAAWTIESLTLGAYLGAVENVQTPQLRLPVGQIAANEAQHLSALAPMLGRPAIGHAFAPSLSIAAVTAALDEYES